MMKGYLKSQGVFCGEHRLAKSMQRISPEGYAARQQDAIDKTNPIPYMAFYIGHKLHMDQNEKLVRYGATHVIAIDGFSSKIVSYTTMPIKNNLTIYNEVYRFGIMFINMYACIMYFCRPAVLSYGLWDQLRVDHGREFYLCLYIQKVLRQQYGPTNIAPFAQTPSTSVSYSFNNIH